MATKVKTKDVIKLKKGDILLLLLYVDNCSPIKGRTRLQKMAFVFENEIYKKFAFNKKLERNVASPFEFKSHNFGPFSAKIFEMMDFFININMVKLNCDEQYEDLEEAVDSIDDEDIYLDDINELMIDDESDNCREPEYVISEHGINYVEDKILNYLSDEQINAITKLKQSFNNYSLNKILKYVYNKYPNMTKDSTIKDKVLG